MQDPIGSFLRIRDLYLSYLDTAFRIHDESVADERRRLLTTPGTLCTEPLVEPLPKYAPSPFDLHELVEVEGPGADLLPDFDTEERRAFVELVLAGLFPSRPRAEREDVPTERVGKFAPYAHQVQMLGRGTRAGSPGIVTSGTGSGKTEAFLLPLLASLAKEAKGWPEPEEGFLRRRWWHDPATGRPYTKPDRSGRPKVRYEAIPTRLRPTTDNPRRSPFRPHREGERRDAAVRALILYPMNALVEDQMVRLRRAIDSREAREVMDREFDSNRIFFGRYTGKTPVTGHEDHPGFRDILDADKDDPELDRVVPGTGTEEDGGVSLRQVRASEQARRRRRQKELFERMVALEEDQRSARYHAGGTEADLSRSPSAFGDEAPFMFPSVDGGEVVSRWDMQAYPPDVLITNVSMLSAMLTREVDEPIFSKTREWLEKPDSYFYLILDELHLQRGSAGTEVTYLLRLLLDRLGLTREEHRHKLRILASSASLPAEPEEEARASTDYLWDMFGLFGLPASTTSEEEGKARWRDSIVPGEEVRSARESAGHGTLDSRPYRELLDFALGRGEADDGVRDETASAPDPAGNHEIERLWWAVARDLGVDDTSDARDVIARCVEEASARLVAACWNAEEERTRATTVRRIGWFLFEDLRRLGGTPADVPFDAALKAVRALLFVRGSGDGLHGFLRGDAPDARSFRMHTFFRSIEGLYAPAWKEAGSESIEEVSTRDVEVGRLSVEREGRKDYDMPEGGRQSLRQFELLYCECCGELFFGGMRSRGSGGTGFLTELLPHEPQLDGLPDAAASQRFEELSFNQYALFWPTGTHDTRVRGETGSRDHGSWRRAFLERETGVLRSPPDGRRGGGVPEGNVVRGFVYERSNSLDKHNRSQRSAETHVPYACPKCGTDYYRRSLGMGRLSPVRNFRAGFAKTTQLLATELFDAQRVANPQGAKLIAFSDSRQDAARAALDIESNHHQDLRRELLIGNLRRFVASKRDAEVVESELAEIQRAISEAAAREDFDEVQEAMPRRTELQEELRVSLEPSVALSSVVEHPDDWDAFGPGKRVSWLIADMVRRGVHPYDDAGVDRPAGLNEQNRTRRFDWDDLFEIRDREVFWRGDPASDATRHTARRQLVRAFHRTMTDVVFSRTYFSPEESGLGYVTVRPDDLPGDRRAADRVSLLSALLRVITDSYRYEPNPYHREDNEVAPWTVYGDVGTRRVKDFARAAWGDAAETRLMEAIDDLGRAGHGGGIVRLPAVRIRLAETEDSYWRCRVCSRVHLHRGAGVCTRCYTVLPEEAAGRVEELRGGNFLARKVVRGMVSETPNGQGDAAFRLHCEELTGQTEDPALRQRKFRGIFVPRVEELAYRDGDADSDGASDGAAEEDGSSSEGRVIDTRLRVSDRAFEAKEIIDLLTVTTTMEVGIDVGPLQTVLQSNMPPQRFNYQQRVGRAGRRGQAFSMALTICRTRSHDTYYFHEPTKITGDVPPTPFLTRRMTDIAERFVRKRWLVDAFSLLREEDRSRPLGLYPGDLMSPPDIHGEFLQTKTYLDGHSGWPTRLRAALRATRPAAEAFRDLLDADGNLERPLVVDAESLLQEMDDSLESGIARGLAHSLAELGLLPMYGMPTRVRDLYLGLSIEDNRPKALSIDRDLDVAIYEFAPGATVVKDKHEHRCVGITPALGLPEYVPNRNDADAIGFQGSPFGEIFRMVQCAVCSAWARLGDTEGVEEVRCEACGAFVSVDAGRDCAVPNAFRTDFGPVSKDEPSSGTRHRSVQAEGKSLGLRPYELDADVGFRARMRVGFDPRARTYRLNRGPLVEGEPMGFEFSRGSQRVRLGRGHIRLPNQAVVDGAALRGFEPRGADEPLWLAAPKTTDSLYVAPSAVHDALSLHRLPAHSHSSDDYAVSRWQGIRAAALSATFLVADRAAAELDIDPSELEVLEPRPYGVEPRLPLLQITDELVNGAGFCRNLSESERGAPKIMRILLSMLSDRGEFPLDRLLAEDHVDCDTACYRCLLRYGNQPYHGLLDWRLGLCYIRAMLDPRFACGLDGEFAHLGLERWQGTAGRLAEEMARRFGGESRTFADGMVRAFRLDSRGGVVPRWVLIAHPLWDWDGSEKPPPDTILARAEEEASLDGPVDCWDTFNLMRRPVQVREWIREGRR